MTLRDSFSWTAHFVNCADSKLRNIKILADTRHGNVDGLDVDGCRRVTAEDLSILRANTMVRIFCYDGARIEDVVFRNLWTEELSMHVPSGFDEFRRVQDVHAGVTYLVQALVRRRKGRRLGSIHPCCSRTSSHACPHLPRSRDTTRRRARFSSVM